LKKVVSLAWKLPGIAAAIKDIRPDYVIFEGASWTLYYLFLLYLIRAARLKSKIVYHAHNVEYALRKQKNHLLIAELTKWGERRLLKNADLTTAVSEIDAACFQRLYGIRPILFPNGVDLERFRAVTPSWIEAIRQKYHLAGKIVLFMGLTAFPPNREAIDYLIGQVFPKLTARFPDAKLAVLGGPVGIKRDWLIAPGSIPYREIPSFIAASDVCVAPIFSGSGTRLKILEYMAAAKPVVSTPKGAEGIHVEAGRDILVANEGDFSKAIERILQDSGLAQKLGSAGYRVVEKEYSWTQILTNFQAHLTPGLGMMR
jgi:glycosyltransferase involved in cell wall biosynthesis